MSNVFPCPRCSYQGYRFRKVLNHIRQLHSHEPDFNIVCGINGCQSSYKVFSSYLTHVYRHHKDVLHDSTSSQAHSTGDHLDESSNVERGDEARQSEVENTALPNDNVDEDSYFGDIPDVKRSIALLILSIREKHKLPTSTTSSILKEICELLQPNRESFREKLKELFQASESVSQDDILTVFDTCTLQSELDLSFLSSEHQQTNYFRDNLNLIEPKGYKFCSDSQSQFQYVSILQSLKSFLQHPDVIVHFLNPTSRVHGRDCDTVLHDFCDGSIYKENALFHINEPTVQLILYHDDFQVANPLGSRLIKISAFYYCIGNLPPQFRSTLKVIQLVSLCRTEVVKQYGYDHILKPILEELRILEEQGINVQVNGEDHVLKGTVSFLAGDNLACHSIGGFLESFTSDRFCRFCMCTRRTLKSPQGQSISSTTNERSVEGYDRQVELALTHTHLASVYGVKTRSPLNELRYFHVINGLPPDPAHDLLEGVCPYVMQKILTYLKQQKLLDVAQINDGITNFPYKGSDKISKPSKLLTTSKLKQTASQMWNFMRFFPLLYSCYVPEAEPVWNLVLLLVSILDIVFMPVQNEETIALMHIHITDFVELLCELFGSNVLIPKVHFLMHYPSLTKKFGPLVHCSTLRFEAKHSYFKSIAKHTKNTKNICFTLAKRHQLLHCYHNASSNILSEDISVATLNIDIDELPDDLQEAISQLKLPGVKIEQAPSVTVSGIKYMKGMCLCTAFKGGLGEFKQINTIVLRSGEVFFICDELKTLYFDSRCHAYVVEMKEPYSLQTITKKDLIDYYPLHLYEFGERKFIVLKHYMLDNRP